METFSYSAIEIEGDIQKQLPSTSLAFNTSFSILKKSLVLERVALDTSTVQSTPVRSVPVCKAPLLF